MSTPPQPLHPSIIPLLDAEYTAFHESTLQYLVPPHTLPWSPSLRELPAVPGGSDPLPVGSTRDITVGAFTMRAFTPSGSGPWPAFIFFHGGGWTFGSISSEQSFATHMCVAANCAVLSVNYRLAPEEPFPAAVEDAEAALRWVVDHGAAELGIDTARIAVGGSSSGGNLAAVLAMKSAVPLCMALLIVPVTDNTIPPSQGTWHSNKHTPWLTPERMLWFRDNYMPDGVDRSGWEASPLLADEERLRRMPRYVWIAVGELDILRGEGEAFGERVKAVKGDDVIVETRVFEGAPHPVMAMDGVLEVGRKLVREAGEALNKGFGLC